MLISVLGPLQLVIDGVDVTPTAPKLRTLIAFLALRRNSVVGIGSLMDELWGESAPASAMATLQTYMYQLRRLFAAHGVNGKEVLITRPVGYELRLNDAEVDVDVFRSLLARARRQLADGDGEAALEILTEALQLCAAKPLDDVCRGEVLESHAAQLGETVLEAIELRVEATMRLGRNYELVSELKKLCAEHPLHEGLHAKLMMVLHRAGRRSEALATYQLLRKSLSRELGIPPSGDVQALQLEILNADTASAVGPGRSATARHARPVTPAQLPPDIAEFTGRMAEIRQLTAMLRPGSDGSAPTVITLTGGPGIGKSASAIRACHAVRNQFQDGQLYVDLRADGAAAGPYHVLGKFLRAAGLRGDQIPPDLDERCELFRSWSADRALLVLLDNAAARDQVRPLLPTGARSAVLITGSQLAVGGLAGSRGMPLRAPSVDDCVAMMASIVGAERVAAESDAVYELVRICDRLPVALRIVAAKVMAGVYPSFANSLQRLAGPLPRLAELRFGEWDLRKTYAAGYQLLDNEGRQALSIMAGAGLTSVTSTRISELCGWDSTSAETLLSQLEQLRFLRSVAAGIGADTFEMPQLVRSFVDDVIRQGPNPVRALSA